MAKRIIGIEPRPDPPPLNFAVRRLLVYSEAVTMKAILNSHGARI